MNLIHSECIAAMKEMPDNSIDSVVTDPPYHLTSIVKRFGKPGSAKAQHGTDGAFARASRGFMGKEWDGGDIAFRVELWEQVWRVLKPGGYVLAFSGSRTYHRMAVAIEDAGFEIRDQLMWIYGSGFPKSHNAGNGWGTALKPAHEPICMARKPLMGTVAANIDEWGTGAINIDGCRVPMSECDVDNINSKHRGMDENKYKRPKGNSLNLSTNPMPLIKAKAHDLGRFPANVLHDGLAEEWARYFYCAKASKKDRGDGNTHPTVKPTDLMRYLCRLVTPPGGIILDPFMGSGSTGKAAKMEGFRFVGCEMEKEYFEIAKARIDAVQESLL